MADRRPSTPRRHAAGAFLATDDVIDEWTALARASRPWDAMYLDDLTGRLSLVVEELLHPIEDGSAGGGWSRLQRVSRAHGAFRQAQGYSGQVLTDEVALVGDAIARVLLRTGASAATIMLVFDALRRDLRSVERAAYSGCVDGE